MTRFTIDREMVRKLVSEGRTTDQIASILGAARRTIADLRGEMGIGPWRLRGMEHPLAKIDAYALKELSRQGKSTREIAEIFGASADHVELVRRKLGVPAIPGSWALKPQSIRIPTDRADLGYLAGLIDGEGSIAIPAKGRPFVSIGNTDRGMIDWILTHIGGNVYEEKRVRQGWKTCWHWRISRTSDVRALLNAVLPFLVTKNQNARRVLALINHNH